MDGELSEVMRWLTVTHTQRWHAHHHSSGTGPIYQGRFKSFPVETGNHFLNVARYIERNPLRANLIERSQDWRWSSVHAHRCAENDPLVSVSPMLRRISDWDNYLSGTDSSKIVDAIREHSRTGRPIGDRCFVQHLEKMTGRKLAARKPGPRGAVK